MAAVDAGERNKRSRPRSGSKVSSVTGAGSVTDQGARTYQVGARIGERGDVYEATSPQLTEPIVIKVFPRAARIDGLAMSAFSREVALAAGLNHPNVARTLGAGMLEGGAPFVVMERLRGETLKELLEHRSPLTMNEAHAVLGGVTSALSAAHLAGLVHGALRPECIFIVEGDLASVKLLDFGARRLLRGRKAQSELDALGPLDDQAALASLAQRMLSGPQTDADAPAAKRPTSAPAPRKGGARAKPSAHDAVSARFFEEGERLSEEAAAAHAGLSSTSLLIPRQRGPMLAWTLGTAAALAALLVGGWSTVWRPLVAARPAATFAARANEPAPSRSAPSARGAAPAAAGTAQARGPTTSKAVPSTKPTRVAATAEQAAARERRARSEAALPPLRGYVWSPAEHRLVPRASRDDTEGVRLGTDTRVVDARAAGTGARSRAVAGQGHAPFANRRAAPASGRRLTPRTSRAPRGRGRRRSSSRVGRSAH